MTPMNPIWGYIAGGFILLMMFSFIGIWIWAWRKRHKPAFNRMARLPLEDEFDTEVDTKENRP
ncbi:MAG: cbb3-type cytochrome c oxidase subunit 3 [Pseudomonadota bacterium]|jgi:cytochrome c oxidase cbb3-type subunit IV|uniref:cbb3-type cytochrome oxidase subunit 3 n=1 Tax=Rhodanobacter sp. OK091 TaxID=1881037 RepID=UPI000916D243|nr:cbb3-type cytochrome c oxidase subunit 3 [Rhodanobacter sp. OK091]SHM07691.1 cytochrome c oxidase cbb3-type subunit 4 [Rhodanobacter sp. OK091]